MPRRGAGADANNANKYASRKENSDIDDPAIKPSHIEKNFEVLAALREKCFLVCFSHAVVLTLHVAPIDVLVHEFKVMYEIGRKTSPPLTLVVTLCNAVCAYQAKGRAELVGGAVSPFALYMTAALCVPCIAPFTLLYMGPVVNARLLELGAKVPKGVEVQKLGASEDEVRELMAVWKRLNFVRAAVAGAAAVLVGVAALA